MVVKQARTRQSGMSLLELTVAVLIGALLLTGLFQVAGLTLRSGSQGHGVNELAYQGEYALERIAEAARGQAPHQLSTPAAGSTGDWFAPLMYCLNTGSRQLIETTTADLACSGSAVLAQNVSSFVSSLPSMGPVDRHSGIFTLTLSDTAGHGMTLTTQVRLGGGTR